MKHLNVLSVGLLLGVISSIVQIVARHLPLYVLNADTSGAICMSINIVPPVVQRQADPPIVVLQRKEELPKE